MWMLQPPVKVLYRDEQGHKTGTRAWCGVHLVPGSWLAGKAHPPIPICTRDGRNVLDGHFSGQEGAKQFARQEPLYEDQHGSLKCGTCFHGPVMHSRPGTVSLSSEVLTQAVSRVENRVRCK